MNILISNDHAGVELKNAVNNFLKNNGYVVENLGDNSGKSVDYPDIIHPLAKEISNNKNKKGIIMCGTGNGVSMVANKYKGVRAGLCWSKEIAELIRKHNDANILSLPARFLSIKEALEIVEVFLKTDFEGGRHERRVNKIDK
ncbi:ribose 5-phosphate isomerase B [Flavobacteriaceae bacterium]|jgi:ribose 5-phosphate isomerase B|nr:ribose 5-phosphate isomerase B [Flavobacteriaceae bacterium]|tara:strand:- start:4404 stop:4832 length:429 start_codon:yes stop_codon:yes gene_type:complete